jgi:hypothetical protein
MAIAATLISAQTVEAQVAGPDGANRLFVTTGLAQFAPLIAASAAADTVVTQQTTFFVEVGPPLTIQQFRKAIATASLSSVSTRSSAVSNTWTITDVDADFDDEAGRVRVEFDVKVEVVGPVGSTTAVSSVGIQVTILAAI